MWAIECAHTNTSVHMEIYKNNFMIFAKQFHLNYSWFFGGCAKSISVGLSLRCICGLVSKISLWNVAALVEEKLHLHPLLYASDNHK